MNYRSGSVLVLACVLSLSFSVGISTAGPVDHTSNNTTQASVTEIEDCTTITKPGYYRLTEDIVDSSAKECILIRANDVVFDGNGHLINGDGRDVGDHRIPITIGYSNQYHVQNVTVKNVIVTEWFQGVGISRASNSTIRNVTTRNNNQYGIYLGNNATNNTVKNSVATDTLENGIFLADYSDNNRIVNNTVRRNRNGISVFDSDRNRISNNSAKNNTNNGILVSSNSSNNLVENNGVVRNGDGITIAESTSENVIRNNFVSDNAKKGIQLVRGASDNELIMNTASNNGRLGFQIHGSNGNLLVNNSAVSNARQGYLLVNATDNVLRNNTAKLNGKWAYEARGSSTNNTVEFLWINDSTPISFSGANLAIAEATPPEPPTGKHSFGSGIAVETFDSKVKLELILHLSDEQTQGVDDSTIHLWRYVGRWNRIENSRYDSRSGRLTGTVTEDSDVVIPLYQEHVNPTESPTASPTPSPVSANKEPVEATTEQPTLTGTVVQTAAPIEAPGQSGFGIAVAILAITVAGLIANRRGRRRT